MVKRQFIGIDNSTTKGARNRGRSSSFRLNGPQRISLPFVIGGDINYTTFLVPSESNAADDGTRNEVIRKSEQPWGHFRKALANECLLFPEHSLKDRFVRGLPRGPAALPLLCAFSDRQKLCHYLDKQTTLHRVDLVHPKPSACSRQRLRSKGRMFWFLFRVGVLSSKITHEPDVLIRLRAADILHY